MVSGFKADQSWGEFQKLNCQLSYFNAVTTCLKIFSFKVLFTEIQVSEQVQVCEPLYFTEQLSSLI